MEPTQALILAVTFLTPCEPPDKAKKGPRDTIQGEWWLVSTRDEKRMTPGNEAVRMILAADGTVILKTGDLTTNHGTFKVSKEGKLQVADFKLNTGVSLAVYEFRGGELWICTDDLGRPRPKGMRPNGSQWLEQWRRVER